MNENFTLRELREQNKKTPAEIAEALGVSKWAVFKYECGNREINIRQVLILSDLYEVSAEEIIRAQINSCQSAQ